MLPGAVPPSRTALARYLRRTMSGIEWNLWSCLRARQLDGFKFRRKALVGPYIVDFACLSARLVVEIDAEMYDQSTGGDDGRAAWLESRDFRVVRFTATDVAERMDQVLDTIRNALAGRPRYLSVAAYPSAEGDRSPPEGATRPRPGRGSFHGRSSRWNHREARGP